MDYMSSNRHLKIKSLTATGLHVVLNAKQCVSSIALQSVGAQIGAQATKYVMTREDARPDMACWIAIDRDWEGVCKVLCMLKFGSIYRKVLALTLCEVARLGMIDYRSRW